MRRSLAIWLLLALIGAVSGFGDNKAPADGPEALRKAIANLDVDGVKAILLARRAVLGESKSLFLAVVAAADSLEFQWRLEHSYENTDQETHNNIDNRGANIVAGITAAGGYALSRDDRLALYMACEDGFNELAKTLIEAGVNPSEPSFDRPWAEPYQATPMTAAVKKGHAEIEAILTAHGMREVSQEERSQLLLVQAAEDSDIQKIEELLKNGADINGRSLEGDTPLEAAVDNSVDYDVVRLLMLLGAKPNTESPASEYPYPLLAAVRCAGRFAAVGWDAKLALEYQVVQDLIGAGAWVSVTDRDGNTPLHYAAKFSLFEIVKLLIDGGAKVSSPNKDGETPLDLAVDGRIIKLLKANGAQESPPMRNTENLR